MRLARYFGGDALSWLNLQAAYDLRVAARFLTRKKRSNPAKAIKLLEGLGKRFSEATL